MGNETNKFSHILTTMNTRPNPTITSDVAAEAAALIFSFEPPVPTGPLLGQRTIRVTVAFKPNDSLHGFLENCRKVLEEAYAQDRLALEHWKDICVRLDSLSYLEHSIMDASALASICNTLGARSIRLAAADGICMPDRSRVQEIDLGADTDYSQVVEFINNLYNAVLYLSGNLKLGDVEGHPDLMAITYAVVAGMTDREAFSRYRRSKRDISWTTIFKFFIGLYMQDFESTGLVDDRCDEFVSFEKELKTMYADHPELGDVEDVRNMNYDGKAWSAQITATYWAVFHEDAETLRTAYDAYEE